MSNEEHDFVMPDSIKACTPCQENVLAGALLSICDISQELQSEIDCQKLSAQINSGEITKQDVIREIVSKAKGKNIESLVNKVLKAIE